jgi:Tfp pilus assembly protein PilF
VGLGIEPERHQDMINWADSLIGRAMSYAPEFWHSHASRALVHYCRKEFADGEREFNTALRLNREETENCGYYFLFLAVSGRAQDALQLTEFVTAEQIDNPVMHANHGMLLASAARYGESQSAFARALKLDRNCWLAHLGAMRLHRARGQGAQAQEHAERAKALLDADEYTHWMAIINALHQSD